MDDVNYENSSMANINGTLLDLNISLSGISSLIPSGNLSEAPVYDLSYQIVSLLVYINLLIVGLIGNAMVIIVVARSTAMHTTTNCYLVSLALADIFVLIASIIPNICEQVSYVDSWAFGMVGCSIFVFMQYLGINAASLSITAFTIERYIAIAHPMRAQTICTISRAKKVIFFIWIFSVLYCSPWLILTTTVEKNFLNNITIESCTFSLERYQYKYIYMADFTIFYVSPLLLTIILYSLIARILCRSMSFNSEGKTASNGLINSKARVNHNRLQVVKMLAIIVALFAILWVPYRLMVVYNSYAKNKIRSLWYLLFARGMIFTNSAINPILYNAMSIKFRREFKKSFGCKEPPKNVLYVHQYSNVSHTSNMDTRLRVYQKTSPKITETHIDNL